MAGRAIQTWQSTRAFEGVNPMGAQPGVGGAARKKRLEEPNEGPKGEKGGNARKEQNRKGAWYA